MSMIKNKTKTITTLFLIFTLTAIVAHLPVAQAATEVTTYSFIAVNPNPLGVHQTGFVVFWLDQVAPTASAAAGDRWQDVTVLVEAPDGSSEELGPFTLDAASSGFTYFTPTQLGTYSFQMVFPGQHIEGFGGWPRPQEWDHDYLPSTSAVAKLVVQEEQIEHLSDAALPTDYWSRPINAETHGWGSITGNWLALASGGPHGPRSYGASGHYNPYGSAPDAGHIVWTKELTFGGIVGGEFDDVPYYPGESYERKFMPPIIMNGRLYYNTRLGSSSWQGFTCVDLQTGEEIWSKAEGTLTCGQLLDMETPNQHGVIPYLWSASGTTWKMYDAFSGEWILDIANVSSGTMVAGKMGELLVYSYDATAGTLSLWNSTLAIQPDIDSKWSWRPAAGTTIDGNNGKQWTVTAPTIAGRAGIKVENDIVYLKADSLAGFDANTGDLLWGPVEINRGDTLAGSMYEISGEYYAEFVRETMQWYGYDVTTGEQIWGPSDAYENAWGFYQSYSDSMVADEILLAAGYDGMVHCYNIATGEHLWDHFAGTSGFETSMGTYPYKDTALAVADGKVYAVNNEHSPSTPFYRGNKMYCIDLETGVGLWDISFAGLAPIIADGYAVAFNHLDNRLYCFGMGESKTTVATSPSVVSDGSKVMITGSITDISAGNPGIACVSDVSMSNWMEYSHMGAEMPCDVTGVTVKLTAIDPNGDTQNIGEVTTDLKGNFGLSWLPPFEGEYHVTASFEGSASYGSSFDTCNFVVDQMPTPGTPIEPETPLITTDVAIIAAVAVAAIIGVAAYWFLKRK